MVSNRLRKTNTEIIAIAVAVLNGKSRAFISLTYGVSVNTVKKVRKKLTIAGITNEDKLNRYGHTEFYNLYYDNSANNVASKPSVFLMPNFTEIAGTISNHADIALEYLKYCQLCDHQDREAMSKSSFYKKVKRELEVIKNNSKSSENSKLAYLPQTYQYGAMCMCDHTGLKVNLVTPEGEVECWIFVVCWPASNYVFAQFVKTQSTLETCNALRNAFIHWSVRPLTLKCDNAKCYVIRRLKDDVIYNTTFEKFLQGLNIVPDACPPYRGQSKSQVEANVALCQSRVVPLIKDSFKICKTLNEHNKVLLATVDRYINQAEYRGNKIITREFLFTHNEKPAAVRIQEPIPEVAIWEHAVTVPRTHLVKYNDHKYSVPASYIRKTVDLKINVDCITIYHEGVNIARHKRIDGPGESICNEHYSQEHQSILSKSKKYKTEQDILEHAKQLDSCLYQICKERLEYDKATYKNNSNSIRNAKRFCIAVINMFNSRAYRRTLLCEALKTSLAIPVRYRNSFKIRDIYRDIIDEYKAKGHISSQSELFGDDLNDVSEIIDKDDTDATEIEDLSGIFFIRDDRESYSK